MPRPGSRSAGGRKGRRPTPQPARRLRADSTMSTGSQEPGVMDRLLRRKKAEEGPRTAELNVPMLHYGDNTISTAKYSAMSFVPRSLLEQFRRVANVYFLGISILMMIGTFLPKIFESPLSAYSTLGPLCLVLAITMAKEGAEDYKRHKSDREVNNRVCRVLVPPSAIDGGNGTPPAADPSHPHNLHLPHLQHGLDPAKLIKVGTGPGEWHERNVLWKDLRVGMIIRTENKGEVPADVVVLQTSEPKSVCYVETSNIDGETNLKLKEAVGATAGACSTAGDVANLMGSIVYEPPNDRIHTFTGKMKLTSTTAAAEGAASLNGDAEAGFVPVGSRNVVLRGCTLRNTKWMLGVVVYAGRDAKVMKKSGGARSKMSQVERTMNHCIKLIFGAQFVLCTITTIALAVWNAELGGQYPYLHLSSTSLWIPAWLGNWFTFLILFNNFIPISLYVTCEMVNYMQAFLIDSDKAMYDPESDTPAKARTSNLNQDLGQIEYVFSDKTGTLTRNVMEFKQCSVGGRIYGTYTPEPDIADADDPATAAAVAAAGRRTLARYARKGFAGAWARFWGDLRAERPAAPPAKRSASPGALSPSPDTTPSTSPTPTPTPVPTPSTAAAAGTGAAAAPARRGRAGTGRRASLLLPPDADGVRPGGFSDPDLMAALRRREGPGGHGETWRPEEGGTGASEAHCGGSREPGAPLSSSDVSALEAFFTCMAVCHTVVPEADEVNPDGPLVYQAESPDEGALTNAARDLGFEFVARHADHIVVHRRTARGLTVPLRYDIYGVHEFNSTRKRMSVVVGSPEGEYLLMCKGADNVIFERAVLEASRPALEENLTKFASSGLRTLTLAQRRLTPEEFAAWQRDFAEASVALSRREERLADVAERYETNLHVLGATAIEDRLQAGVPGTIRDLARAGIKTWVLTGDKLETAITIAFGCRLLDDTMELIQIASEDPDEVHRQLTALEKRFRPLLADPVNFIDKLLRTAAKVKAGVNQGLGGLGLPFVKGDTSHAAGHGAGGDAAVAPAGGEEGAGGFEAPPSPGGSKSRPSVRVRTNIGIVVTGLALTHIINHPEWESAFLTVARCCRAVIACRVSPQQKAQIVRLVRKGITPAPMTLAIGDGANDVGMIQRAQVGVGISGKEGLQAVNSADFAIAQFRFLRRLLLVHGRWDYRRMSKVVLYSFYKNVVITLTLFYFNALTGFSGTSFYESLVYSSYNFVLGLPIIFVGILDQDISASTALKHPAVYSVGMFYADLSMRKMGWWILRAFLHSAIIFWLPYGGDAPIEGTNSSDGQVDGLTVAGLTTFIALVWSMQVKVALETRSWTKFNHIFLWLSMAVFYVFILVYQLLQSFTPEFYYVVSITLSRPFHWLAVLLVVGVILVCDFVIELLRLQSRPSPSDVAVELDRGYGEPDPVDGAIYWGDEDLPADHPRRARATTTGGLSTTAAAAGAAPEGAVAVGLGAAPAAAADDAAAVAAAAARSPAPLRHRGADVDVDSGAFSAGPTLRGGRHVQTLSVALGTSPLTFLASPQQPPGTAGGAASEARRPGRILEDAFAGEDEADTVLPGGARSRPVSGSSAVGGVTIIDEAGGLSTIGGRGSSGEGGLGSPPSTPSSLLHSTLVAQGSQRGFVNVPAYAVLGDMDEAGRREMGIIRAGSRHGFDYSSAVKAPASDSKSGRWSEAAGSAGRLSFEEGAHASHDDVDATLDEEEWSAEEGGGGHGEGGSASGASSVKKPSPGKGGFQ